MRLLYVSHSFPLDGRPLSNVGGMQRAAVELCAALEARPDVRLVPLVLRSSGGWMAARAVPFGVGLLRRIPALVDRHRIEAVLFSSMAVAAVALPLRRALRARGVPTAAIALGLDVTLPLRPYQRLLLPHILAALDLVLPISRATADACLARGAPRGRVRVLPCGVDPRRFPEAADRAGARAALERAVTPLPAGSLLLFSIGRHVARKGFAWFVDRVMPALPDAIHCWIGGSGPETAAIRAAVDRHGLQARVRLLGPVPEERLPLLYRGSDLFVMPNVPVAGDIEGFGLVLLEAGLSGLPAIAADLEGIRDVVIDGRNGVRVPAGDAPAFARAILALHDDRARLAEAGRAASRFIAGRYTWPVVADRYVAALRELVAATRSS